MTDSDESPSGDVPPASERPRLRQWRWIALLSVVLVPALLLTLWTVITMSYSYSSGDRAGYIQKLSRKGWLCKTWEGELAIGNMPGALQERFEFTVRSDSLAAAINALQGQRVSLHYREHRGIPLSCFGETSYFIDGVRSIDPVPFPGIDPRSGASPATPVPQAPRRDTIDPPSRIP